MELVILAARLGVTVEGLLPASRDAVRLSLAYLGDWN
jgi:hypothetical protein